MKSSKLIKALEEGKILYNDHDPSGAFDQIEFLFLVIIPTGRYLEIKGWGTALGSVKDRLKNIIEFPDDWKIHKFDMNSTGHPYPWSIDYKKIK
jgi:hypothetical protein